MHYETSTETTAAVRRYYPSIDSEIRGYRNDAIGAIRDADRRFHNARLCLEDAEAGWLRGLDADRAAAEWFEIGMLALERAAYCRREMHRLIRFRRTGILE